jgi:hypothetical protein
MTSTSGLITFHTTSPSSPSGARRTLSNASSYTKAATATILARQQKSVATMTKQISLLMGTSPVFLTFRRVGKFEAHREGMVFILTATQSKGGAGVR